VEAAAVVAALVDVGNPHRGGSQHHRPRARPGAAQPWFPASRGYVNSAVSPVLVVGLRNTIEIIEAREAAIRVRQQMASNRLLAVPDDPIARDALDAANRDIDAAENQKIEALCDLRTARGLLCGR